MHLIYNMRGIMAGITDTNYVTVRFEDFISDPKDPEQVLNSELLVIKNLFPILNELHTKLFFAQPDGLYKTLISGSRRVSEASSKKIYDPSFPHEMIAHLRKLFSSEISRMFRAPPNFSSLRGDLDFLSEMEDVEEALESLKSHFKELTDQIDSNLDIYKSKTDAQIDELHKALAEDKDYLEILSQLEAIALFVGRPNGLKTDKQTACYLYYTFEPSLLIEHLILTKIYLIKALVENGQEAFGEDYPEVLRLQTLIIAQELWRNTLHRIAKDVKEDKGSLRYSYTIIKALRQDKLAFYQGFYKSREKITCAAIAKIRGNTTLARLQQTTRSERHLIDKFESDLKCYSWDQAVLSGLWLNVTGNIFFTLGEELAKGVKMTAPELLLGEHFSHLAGSLLLAGQIYLSPTVAGGAIAAHAAAQGLIGDSSRMTHYASKFTPITEDRIYQQYPNVLYGSSILVSVALQSLTSYNESLLKIACQIAGSASLSHYSGKLVDRYSNKKSQSYPLTRLTTALFAHTLGSTFGSSVWQTGADLHFERYSDKPILLDAELCPKFPTKCLKEAFQDFCVEEGTPFKEISKLYRRYAIELHPDKHPEIDPIEFKRLGIAWNLIRAHPSKFR